MLAGNRTPALPYTALSVCCFMLQKSPAWCIVLDAAFFIACVPGFTKERTRSMLPSQSPVPRQNFFTYYLRMLLYMCGAVLLRVVSLAPVASLWSFPAGSPWKALVLLCPVMVVFFLWPLRFSFAQAMIPQKQGRYFSFDTALSLSRYGEKLGESLLHALAVAKWAIPLVVLLGVGCYYYQSVNVMALLTSIQTLGVETARILRLVFGFFGNAGAAPAEGGIMEGVFAIGAVAGICVLILLIGIMRNSAYRYVWAIANHEDRNPRTEARRCLRGRRGPQLLMALANLLLLVPFLFLLSMLGNHIVGNISLTSLLALSSGTVVVPYDFTRAVDPLIFSFTYFYLLLLPLRRIITVGFVARGMRRSNASGSEGGAPVAGMSQEQ